MAQKWTEGGRGKVANLLCICAASWNNRRRRRRDEANEKSAFGMERWGLCHSAAMNGDNGHFGMYIRRVANARHAFKRILLVISRGCDLKESFCTPYSVYDASSLRGEAAEKYRFATQLLEGIMAMMNSGHVMLHLLPSFLASNYS